MKRKLTLRIEDRLIDRAEEIARQRGKSISQLVATILSSSILHLMMRLKTCRRLRVHCLDRWPAQM